jgi:hypothetical protein
MAITREPGWKQHAAAPPGAQGVIDYFNAPKHPTYQVPANLFGYGDPKAQLQQYGQTRYGLTKQEVDTGSAYLNNNEVKLFLAAGQKRAAAMKDAQAQVAKLRALASLSQQGPQGVRQQQAYLHQQGVNIEVDGQYGPQTQKALQGYLQQQQDDLNTKVQDAHKNIQQYLPGGSFPTERAQTNLKLATVAKGDRSFVQSQIQQNIQQINSAVKDIQTKAGPGGVPTASKDKSTLATLQEEYAKWSQLSNNLSSLDNVALHDIAKNITDSHIAARDAELYQQKHEGDFGNRVKQSLGLELSWLVKYGLGPLNEEILNRGHAAFAAAFEGKMHGNALTAIQAGISSLSALPFTHGKIGLGSLLAPKGSEAYKQVQATYTQEQRDELVRSGDLLSPGQAVLGRETNAFRLKHPGFSSGLAQLGGNENTNIGGAHHDIASGLFDVAFTLAADPVNLVGLGAEPFEMVGEHAGALAVAKAGPEAEARLGKSVLAAFGRRVFLDESPTGRGIANSVADAVTARSNSALDLVKAIHGLPEAVADKAIAAKAASELGTEGANMAATKVILDAFVEGKFDMKVGVVRQLRNAAADKIGLVSEENAGRAFGLGIGRSVQFSDRLTLLRDWAAPRGATATAFADNAREALVGGISAAARAETKTWRSVWHDAVESAIHGVDVPERMYQVRDKIREMNNPVLNQMLDGTMHKYFSNADLIQTVGALPEVPVARYMEAVAQLPGFEDSVRHLETALAIMEGKAGAKARLQLEAELTGFLLPKRADATALYQAASRTGVKLGKKPETATVEGVTNAINKLPSELQDHFGELLSRLGTRPGKDSLRTLMRDVSRTLEEKGLQTELKEVLKEQAERALAASKNVIERPGIGKRLAQGVAKAGLSLVEVVPPAELKFRYSENAALDIHLRGQAMDRYLGAFNVPLATRNELIHAAQSAKTEDDMFDVARRALRATLQTKRVPNADAVIELLENRGDFVANRGAKTPMRYIDPQTGEIVSDLQTLAQRIESARVPSPEKVAAAVRQAIVDGTQDPTRALELGERLKVFVDSAKNIRIIGATNKAIVGTAHGMHSLWKWLVVTNGAMPVVGFVAGFAGAGGDLQNRLAGGAVGFGVGLASTTRTIFRITGLESRLRMILADGLHPDAMIPGMAKMMARRYGEDPFRRELSQTLTMLGQRDADFLFNNATLVHMSKDWVALERGAPRYVDGWWRILNHQVNPESDPVMAILLREQAGHLEGRTVTESVTDQVSEKVARSRSYPTLESLVRDGTLTAEEAADPAVIRSYAAAAAKGGKADLTPRTLEDLVHEGKLTAGEAANPAVQKSFSAAEEKRIAGLQKTVTRPVQRSVARQLTAREEADALIKEFLGTEEGALWQKRWARAYKGSRTSDKAVARMRNFLDTYSNADLAALRVAGGASGAPAQIDRATLKRLTKSGVGPDVVHAQDAWKGARRVTDLFKSYQNIETRMTLTGPDNILNRRPWHQSLFGREYDRLLRNGVEPAEAQEIADTYATKRLNTILHRYEEPTRFAAKIDMFMPFQHAREDIFRAYSRILVENPRRAVRLGEYAARAFNVGSTNGTFTKNEFTGQWEVTVPGSGRLSKALFQTPYEVPFSANLKDMLFVTGGAYNIGIVPQPGGPFWSVFSRELADHYPDVFKGDNAVVDFMFPYGPSGTLVRKDTSRLWMALTGSPAPWEFETHDQIKNEWNHWQDEIARELMYRNRLKGGDANYVPAQSEIDDAAQKFFLSWVFFSTTTPATTYPVMTSQDKYNAALNTFTLGGILPSPEASADARKDFLKKFPEFEAYLGGGGLTKYTGPDDLATLRKYGVGQPYNQYSKFNPESGAWEAIPQEKGAGEDYRHETQVGVRGYIPYSEWKDKFLHYKRVNQYYAELDSAFKTPNIAQREYAISAVYQKYGDVVGELKRKDDITRELAAIYQTYPKALQDAAVQRVRTQYHATNQEVLKFQRKAQDPQYVINPWHEARQGWEIAQEVDRKLGGESSLHNTERRAQYVAQLSPAEQARYWQHMMNSVDYDKELDQPKAVLDRYDYYQKQYFAVSNDNPYLYRTNNVTTPDLNFDWGSVATQPTEDSPGGPVALDKNTQLSRFGPDRVREVLLGYWKQITDAYPEYTKRREAQHHV